MKRISIITALAICSTGFGCSDTNEETPGEGSYTLTAYGEAFVEDKIPAEETDGWEIDFTSLEITISDLSARNDDGESVDANEVFTVELTEDSGGEGHSLTTIEDAPAGRYDDLTYRIAPADGNPAIRVEGTATKDSTTKTFSWTFDTDELYENCETDAMLTDGGTAKSELTIHADHFFYDDLESPEPNVAFDLIASADADDDGDITLDELAAVDITGETRYQVGSRDISDLRAFIEAQTKTLGHIDGEGHCD
jgi:hypothetical protein